MCAYFCFSYPACKSHIFWAVLYWHLWTVWLYHILAPYLKNGNTFEEKKKKNMTFFFRFSLQRFSETFVILMRTERDMNKMYISLQVGKKVKCPLVQALRFCTGRTPHKGSRGIALHFYTFMTTALEGVRGQRHAPAALYHREIHGTHCTGGWVGPRAGLDWCGKFRSPPGFDPWTVQPVANLYTD